MPLSSGKSSAAFSSNVKTEMAAGKPQRQAVAIAYAKQRGDAAPAFKEGDHPRAKDGQFTSVMEKKGGGEHVAYHSSEPGDAQLNAQARKAGHKKGDLFPSFDIYDKKKEWHSGGGGRNSGYVDAIGGDPSVGTGERADGYSQETYKGWTIYYNSDAGSERGAKWSVMAESPGGSKSVGEIFPFADKNAARAEVRRRIDRSGFGRGDAADCARLDEALAKLGRAEGRADATLRSDAWSPEARKAAAEARKKVGSQEEGNDRPEPVSHNGRMVGSVSRNPDGPGWTAYSKSGMIDQDYRSKGAAQKAVVDYHTSNKKGGYGTKGE